MCVCVCERERNNNNDNREIGDEGISLAIDIEIEDEQLSLFGAIAASDGADQPRLIGSNSPDNTTTSAAFQHHQITNKFT